MWEEGRGGWREGESTREIKEEKEKGKWSHIDAFDLRQPLSVVSMTHWRCVYNFCLHAWVYSWHGLWSCWWSPAGRVLLRLRWSHEHWHNTALLKISFSCPKVKSVHTKHRIMSLQSENRLLVHLLQYPPNTVIRKCLSILITNMCTQYTTNDEVKSNEKMFYYCTFIMHSINTIALMMMTDVV